MSLDTSQSEITNWFNKTYKNRGEWYLRPVKAYYIFLELLQPTEGQKILDVACGLGRLLTAAKEYKLKLYGIDISVVAILKTKRLLPEASISEANAENLPFDDNTFDHISCLGSLERIIHLPQALKEMYRVGKGQARYCFLVRNANTVSWKYIKKALGLQNKSGHQGAKMLEEWRKIFEDAGFSIKEIWPDQYPIFKRKKWKTLGLISPDYKKPVRSNRPLEEANEFIFILEKA